MAGNGIDPTGAQQTIPDAATAMEGLLDRMDAAPEEGSTAPAQSKDQTPVAETTAEPEVAETPAEAPQGEEAEAAEGEESADEGAADEAPPAPELYTVKVDGKREQVSLKEALNGYQRSQDYFRKTEDLANQRKSFEVERQSVSAERAQYQQMLQALQGQLQQMQPQKPDRILLDSDPIEYTRQNAIWMDHQERLQAAQYEQQRVQALQAQEQQGLSAKLIAENRQKMMDAVPHWKDNEKWLADRPKLLEYGKKLGFTDQELSQASDYRAVVALYKAMQYDALMSRSANGSQQPRPVQRAAPRVAAAGNANTAPRVTSQLTRQKQRLAQTGKVSDAATLLENLDL